MLWALEDYPRFDVIKTLDSFEYLELKNVQDTQ